MHGHLPSEEPECAAKRILANWAPPVGSKARIRDGRVGRRVRPHDTHAWLMPITDVDARSRVVAELWVVNKSKRLEEANRPREVSDWKTEENLVDHANLH